MENENNTFRNLQNQDFSGRDLSQMNLSGCDLTGCRFDGSFGKGLDVSGSVLTDTSWVGAEQIDLKAADIVAQGTLDHTGFMAPGADFTRAKVARWLIRTAELTHCRVDGAEIGVLVGGAADMTDASAEGWKVGSIEGEHNRLPRVTS